MIKRATNYIIILYDEEAHLRWVGAPTRREDKHLSRARKEKKRKEKRRKEKKGKEEVLYKLRKGKERKGKERKEGRKDAYPRCCELRASLGANNPLIY